MPDPGTDPDRENPAGEPVEPAGTRTGAETFRDYLRAVNGLPPSGSPAAGPEDGPPDNRTEAERLAAYWVGINSFDPPGGWGAPQNAPADRGPVRFQWQVGRGGVGDFVRVPNFDNSSGQPGVVIEPSREGATFAAVARPGDGDTSRIDVNTGQIQPGGSQRRTIRRSKGDQAPIPPTRRPLTAAEGRRFLGSRSCRGRGPPSPALVPSRRAPVERPAQPAPAQPQEPTWQQRAGQVGGVLLDVMTYPHPLGPRGALGPLI